MFRARLPLRARAKKRRNGWMMRRVLGMGGRHVGIDALPLTSASRKPLACTPRGWGRVRVRGRVISIVSISQGVGTGSYHPPPPRGRGGVAGTKKDTEIWRYGEKRWRYTTKPTRRKHRGRPPSQEATSASKKRKTDVPMVCGISALSWASSGPTGAPGTAPGGDAWGAGGCGRMPPHGKVDALTPHPPLRLPVWPKVQGYIFCGFPFGKDFGLLEGSPPPR